MKIQRKVITQGLVDIDVELPYFTKNDGMFYMVFADQQDEFFNTIAVRAEKNIPSIMQTTQWSAIKAEPCTREEFLQAFFTARALLTDAFNAAFSNDEMVEETSGHHGC